MDDMKSSASTRAYRMSARAQAAERTAHDILAAAAALWRERAMDEITLAAIAERAGVSVRTVIRRFGSREGVIAACIASDAAGIVSARDQAAAGDVDGALRLLLGHYERDGDAVLRTLALEETVAEARAIAAAGREGHRAWCARVFAPFLPPIADGAYAVRLDAFVAATDLYAWKLLRRDLGRTADEAARVIRTLVEGLASLPSI
jgi:AcrR family transcriptional regulator